jgi:phage-related minor tail protein
MIYAMGHSKGQAERLAKIWKDIKPEGTETSGAQAFNLLARKEETISDGFFDANIEYAQAYSDFIESAFDLGEIAAGYIGVARKAMAPFSSVIEYLINNSEEIKNKVLGLIRDASQLTVQDITTEEAMRAATKELNLFWEGLKGTGAEVDAVKTFLSLFMKKNQENLHKIIYQIEENRKKETEQHQKIIDISQSLKKHYSPPQSKA